jgi:Phage protein (N4 Gp49/phage Sf6 gene 66) family
MSALEGGDAAAEAVRTGFRITLDDLKARVAEVEYIERGVLNVCLMRLDNGFWLVGKSAPVDPANYNAEYGRTLACEDALRQAWPLLAFAHLEAPR